MATIGAFVHIINEDRKILLLKQNYGKFHWTVPGGRVEPKEDIVTAAIREAREETGYNVELCGLLGNYAKPYRDDLVVGFYGNIISTDHVWQPNEEISEMGWFAIDELPDHMSFNTRYRVLDALHGRKAVVKVFQQHDALTYDYA